MLVSQDAITQYEVRVEASLPSACRAKPADFLREQRGLACAIVTLCIGPIAGW